ncbi:MAG: hypothetical protein P4L27_06090 [Ignavibacteriaceae bacterium]|nr:hypothetical protein [Ignavibacteriaceae bacterium]
MEKLFETYFKKCGDAEQIRFLLSAKDRDENNIVLGLILFNIQNIYPSINYELISNNLEISQISDSYQTRLNFSFKNDRLYLYLRLNPLSLFSKVKEHDPALVEDIIKILFGLGFFIEDEKYLSDGIKYYILNWS